jgi:hypothetical protein
MVKATKRRIDALKTAEKIAGILLIATAFAYLLQILPQSESPTGSISVVDIAPKGFSFVPPDDTSPETALFALENSQTDIDEMKKLNMSTTYSEDVLDEAKAAYDAGEYRHVLKLTQLITFVRQIKTDYHDEGAIIRIREKNLRASGVDTSSSLEIMARADDAFKQDRIDEARELLEKSSTELETLRAENSRIRTIARLGKGFFAKYWIHTIATLIVVAIALFPVIETINKHLMKRKLALLRLELRETQNLIKNLQKECFIDEKISTHTYRLRAVQYEKRIAEIKHTIPVFEARLKGKNVKKTASKVKAILDLRK